MDWLEWAGWYEFSRENKEPKKYTPSVRQIRSGLSIAAVAPKRRPPIGRPAFLSAKFQPT